MTLSALLGLILFGFAAAEERQDDCSTGVCVRRVVRDPNTLPAFRAARRSLPTGSPEGLVPDAGGAAGTVVYYSAEGSAAGPRVYRAVGRRGCRNCPFSASGEEPPAPAAAEEDEGEAPAEYAMSGGGCRGGACSMAMSRVSNFCRGCVNSCAGACGRAYRGVVGFFRGLCGGRC